MNVDPDHPQELDAMLAMIESEAESQPVFFKDMSYHTMRCPCR
jgi:hypothetical protein